MAQCLWEEIFQIVQVNKADTSSEAQINLKDKLCGRYFMEESSGRMKFEIGIAVLRV